MKQPPEDVEGFGRRMRDAGWTTSRRMIEDGHEFHRLIAEVFSDMRPPERVAIMPPVAQGIADEVVKWKWRVRRCLLSMPQSRQSSCPSI